MTRNLMQILVELPWSLDILLKISLILCLGWASHFAFARSNPRWRLLLWRAVAVGMLLVPLLGLVMPTLKLTMPHSIQADVVVPNPRNLQPLIVSKSAPILTSSETPAMTQPQHAPPQSIWITVTAHPWISLFILWASFCTILAVKLVISLRGVRRLLLHSVPVDGNVQETLDDLRGHLGINRMVELRASGELSSPFLYGFRHPVIVLPDRMTRGDYIKELPAIFVHELTHLKGQDLAWMTLLHIISIALWFHPLAWRMRAAHAAACEAVCDAVAARHVGSPLAYSRTLARIALELVALPPEVGGIAMARMPEVRRRLDQLKQRIDDSPLARRWITVTIVLGFSALSIIAGIRFVAAGTGSLVGSADSMGNPKTITLQGRVETEDGKPLPRSGVRLNVSGTRSDVGQFSTLINTRADGTFNSTLDYGSIDLACQYDGYAIAEAGPFTAQPGGTVKEIRIVLKRGFQGFIHVVDPKGQPIADAKFTGHFNYFTSTGGQSYQWTRDKPLRTNARGVAVIDGVSSLTLNLSGMAPGYEEEAWTSLKLNQNSTATLTMRPSKPTEGIIIEATTGKPIPGAKLHLFHQEGGIADDWSQIESGPVLATSDPAGRFRLDMLREDTKYYLYVEAEGSRRVLLDGLSAGQKDLRIEMHPRLFVRGNVLGPEFAEKNGNTPLIRYKQPFKAGRWNKTAQGTIELKVMGGIGHFEIDRLWEGNLEITAGSQSKTIQITDSIDNLTLDLRVNPTDRKGGTSPAQVTGNNSTVGYIGIGLASPAQDNEKIRDEIGLQKDQKGVLVFNVLAGSPAANAGLKEGDLIIAINNTSISSADELTDTIRKQKIGSEIKLTFLRPEKNTTPKRMEVEAQIIQRPDLRQVDEPGVRKRAESAAKPQLPEWTLSGVALIADGKPAEGAEVVLCEPNNRGSLFQFKGNPDEESRRAEIYKQDAQIVITGPDGKFMFKTHAKYFGLVVRHSDGVTIVNEETLPKDGKVKVHPWGRVEGVLKEGDKVVQSHMVNIDCDTPRNMPLSSNSINDIPRIIYSYMVTTDDQGRFVFDHIHSGLARIGARVDMGDGTFTFNPMLPINIMPDETTRFNLGGMGRRVIGRVMLNKYSDPSYRIEDCMISLRPSAPRPPESVTKQGRNAVQKWRTEWEQTPEGKAYDAIKNYYRDVQPDQDGVFQYSDVPAGKFSVQITANEMRELKLPPGVQSKIRRVPGQLLDMISKEFEIPPMKGGRSDEPLDLGKMEILAAKVPTINEEAPDFKCVTLAGAELALKDYRGKFVLLDFWATWCGPCIEETPVIKAVWKEYGKQPNFSMIGLNLDNDIEAPEKFIKENEMGWMQGYLGKWADNKVTKEYGIKAIPEIMLIGPDGRIIEKSLSGKRIAEALAEALKDKKSAR